MRHSLSDESTRAATVLGSWAASFPDLIPCSDIVGILKDESKHSKGKCREGGSTTIQASNGLDATTDAIMVN